MSQRLHDRWNLELRGDRLERKGGKVGENRRGGGGGGGGGGIGEGKGTGKGEERGGRDGLGPMGWALGLQIFLSPAPLIGQWV